MARSDIQPSSNFEQGSRILRGDHEQGPGGPGRRPPPLLPVWQGPHRHAEQLGETGLGPPGPGPRLGDVGHVDHAADLAALDLPKTLEDLCADVPCLLNHFPPRRESPRNTFAGMFSLTFLGYSVGIQITPCSPAPAP